MASVVTPGQSARQDVIVSGLSHLPSPHIGIEAVTVVAALSADTGTASCGSSLKMLDSAG